MTSAIEPAARGLFRDRWNDVEIHERIRAGEYEFVDFGSSQGGSIDYCMRRFHARKGLGIDLGADEVAEIRSRGFDAIQGDVLDFRCPSGSFRFVSMMDFLEHLPNLQAVERALTTAKRVARDFLFIRHPTFDDEPYLNSIGLKQYWTDWSGHPSKITLAEYTQMFERLELSLYCLRFRTPAYDSADPVMLPLSAPPDQLKFDLDLHGPRPEVVFPRPVWGQLDIFVALRSLELWEWKQICAGFD
ncbi:MAG: class I SAM-dependent methyltransferase [Actinomycetota bacterium]